LERELQKSLPNAVAPIDQVQDLYKTGGALIRLAGLDACRIKPKPVPDWVRQSVELGG
jgi:hypothetical protein